MATFPAPLPGPWRVLGSLTILSMLSAAPSFPLGGQQCSGWGGDLEKGLTLLTSGFVCDTARV